MKKPITNFLVAITCALVLLSSCASSFEQAGEALAQGDYTRAIEKSLKSIEKGDDVPAAETVLKDAWQRANSEWNAQIATIEQATTYDELSKVIPVYNKLLAVHKMVAAAGRSELSPTYDAIQKKGMETQNRMAEMLFKEASATIALGGRENAQKAIPQYARVKELKPDYPGIDDAIVQATLQATVTVYVATGSDFSSYNREKYNLSSKLLLQELVTQLGSKDFVKIVEVNPNYVNYGQSEETATKQANETNADILVFFTSNTSFSTEVTRDVRPIDLGMETPSKWEIEKLYLLASGKSEVSYKVIDLKTDTTLGEGTMNVEDSTDADFSVSAIRHKGRSAKMTIGDMPAEKKVLLNSLYAWPPIEQFQRNLRNAEKIESIEIEAISRNGRYGINFNEYKSIDELDEIYNLNGHTFFLFDAIEVGSDLPENDRMYFMTYNNPYGGGTEGNVNAAEADRLTYSNLFFWMNMGKAKDSLTESFIIQEFCKKTVPLKIAEKIAPLLK